MDSTNSSIVVVLVIVVVIGIIGVEMIHSDSDSHSFRHSCTNTGNNLVECLRFSDSAASGWNRRFRSFWLKCLDAEAGWLGLKIFYWLLALSLYGLGLKVWGLRFRV